MALNSAYFQPFSFGGDDTSPSYDPSTDDELDWMQYAGRNAYAAKGGGRPQGARPLPTSGSAQQKTQTALVPQPADDYLNPPPSASSSAYLNNTLNIAQDYLNGVQQPNPGGGAVTSRVVGGGDGGHQAEYLAALNALPEWQTANAAAEFLKARSGKYTDPRVVENKLALISQNRALAGQRLQAERPDLFKQQQPEQLSGDGKYVQRNGRWEPNFYYTPEMKPVGRENLVPDGSGGWKVPMASTSGQVTVQGLPGVIGSRSAEQEAVDKRQLEQQKLEGEFKRTKYTADSSAGAQKYTADSNLAGRKYTADHPRPAASKNDDYTKLQKDLDTERKNRDSLQKQRAQMLATVKDDDDMVATLENKPGADPAMIDRLKRTRAAKLAANSTWGTTNDAYTKSMERIVSIQESMDRLRETPQSGDGLPSPGTSGDRTDAPVPKPSQIKPPPADASSKISTTQAPDTNGGAKPRNRVLKGAKDKQGRTGTLTLAPDGKTVISFVPDGPVDGA